MTRLKNIKVWNMLLGFCPAGKGRWRMVFQGWSMQDAMAGIQEKMMSRI